MNEFNMEFAPVYRNYISLADDILSIEDLAVGVAEKKVMPSFASQQRLELYVKVKSKLNRFSNEVANLKVPIFRSMKF
ncbi:MAG: hypothetical protein CL784_09305 [Chloroflexi bacterium]|nr:hypothetical protein [Chloroflexota bacterium]